ncbi:MAG: hypothetical protein R3Y28_05255 [Candidatus Gastranaerophilales bacterium]
MCKIGLPKLISPTTTPNINTPNPNNKENTKKFNDPLNNLFFKSMSHSNEVGTAIMEVSPKLGVALWAPTLMFLGADIYDKYRNNKTEFDPDPARGLERGIFQGIMSLAVMPAAISLTQKIVSPISKFGKHKISNDAKDAIIRHTNDVINISDTETLNNPEKFKKSVLETLENKLSARKTEKNLSGFVDNITNFFTQKYPMLNTDKKLLFKYAEENVDKICELKMNIEQGNKKEVPKAILKKYDKVLSTMTEIYGHDNYALAMKNALSQQQKSLIFQNKILKTFVGFAALVFLDTPLNKFVENKIMPKYISPEINMIYDASSSIVIGSNLKNIFNELDKKNDETTFTEKSPDPIQKITIAPVKQ